MEKNIWKIAAREKLVIITPEGQVGFTHLWDLPLTANRGLSLDGIYRYAVQKINETEISLVRKENPEREHWTLVKELVEEVYADIQAEQEAAKKRKMLEEQYVKIQEALKAKEERELTKAKKSELEKKLAEIEQQLKIL